MNEFNIRLLSYNRTGDKVYQDYWHGRRLTDYSHPWNSNMDSSADKNLPDFVEVVMTWGIG